MSTLHQVIVMLGNGGRAQALSKVLSNESVNALPAGNSDELRTLLSTRRVDAIVIEHNLSGFLTGLEILERLHADLLRPTALLLGDLSPLDRMRADGLKVACILPASATMEQVREAIGTALLTADCMAAAIPQPARALVREADFIRPLPQLISKLAKYIGNDSGSLAELVQDISVDPKITASLIRLTNSAAIGLPRKVTRVFDAINLLGIRRTIALVLSDGLVKAQACLLKSLPEEFSFWFHTRSVLIACTVSAFARKMHGICEDTAYLLGLFQEMGILVLAQTHTDRYLRLLERFRSVAQLQLHIIEQQQFGMTHADISAALMQRWDLPMSLTSLVHAHHDDSKIASQSPVEQQFLHSMRIGEAVADLRDVTAPQRHHRLQRLLETFGTKRAEDCRDCMAQSIAKAKEASDLFNTPLPDDSQLEGLLTQLQSVVGVPAPDVVEEDSAADAPHDAAASPADVEQARGAPDSATDLMPPIVLVIDDEPEIISMVKLMLSQPGVQVLSSRTTDEALALVSQVQAVLCDVHLGTENGISLVNQFRSRGFDGPTIMVSGDRTRSTVTDALDAGVVDYLAKPFTQAALLDKLNRHLGLSLAVHSRRPAHAKP